MIAALVGIALFTQSSPVCPVTGKPVARDAKMVDVNGIRFKFCSQDCVAKFKQDPLSIFKSARDKGWLVGVGVFDPVSGRKLTPQTARGGSSDYKSVRFAFLRSENKADFDSNPATYGAVPDKWLPYCPVMGIELVHTYGASGYADLDGVRYFACCDQCWPRLKQYISNVDRSRIGPPKAFDVPAVWAKLSGPGF
jgi:YHS domain-containing protein